MFWLLVPVLTSITIRLLSLKLLVLAAIAISVVLLSVAVYKHYKPRVPNNTKVLSPSMMKGVANTNAAAPLTTMQKVKDECHTYLGNILVKNGYARSSLVQEKSFFCGLISCDTYYTGGLAIDWAPNDIYVFPNGKHKSIEEFEKAIESYKFKETVFSKMGIQYVMVPIHKIEERETGRITEEGLKDFLFSS